MDLIHFIVGLIGLGGMVWYCYQAYKEYMADDYFCMVLEGMMIVPFFLALRAGWLV